MKLGDVKQEKELAFFSGLSHKWGIPLLCRTVSLYALDCPQYSNSKDDDQVTAKTDGKIRWHKLE